jgi:hypothetical protein
MKSRTESFEGENDTLTLVVIEGKYIPLGTEITISSNKINNKCPLNENCYVFGRSSSNSDFVFPEQECIGDVQFAINYIPGKY